MSLTGSQYHSEVALNKAMTTNIVFSIINNDDAEVMQLLEQEHIDVAEYFLY